MNRNVRGAALLVMAASVLVALVPYFGAEDSAPDRLRYSISFAAPFFAAGLLALVSDRLGRPRYVMAAGVALLPISAISIVALPLVAPALMLILLGARATRPGWSIEMPATIVIVVCFVASMLSLLLHDDPASWTAGDGHHHSTSDLVTGTESLISAGFLVAAFAIVLLVVDRAGPGSAAGEERFGDAVGAGLDGE